VRRPPARRHPPPHLPDARSLELRGGLRLLPGGGRARVLSVRGIFITFEGVEGSGKTTQMMRLARALRREGHRVERTREPDGVPLGVTVSRAFERPGAVTEPLAETFLFMAARRQHVIEKIGPWLGRGRVVLCDRYTDATIAYQGHGRGVDVEL